MPARERAVDWDRMVDALRPLPRRIEEALRRVPRHCFVPNDQLGDAYEDEPLPLPEADATISAPHMVGLQLEAANLQPGQRVAEIGAGFGYLSALLGELVGPTGRVIAIEVAPSLSREAHRRLRSLGYTPRVDVVTGDGRSILAPHHQFDRILVSCATPRLEPTWVEALRPDGILVAPVGNRYEQRLVTYRVSPDGSTERHGPLCRFVSIHRPVRHGIYRPAK
ncbi:MAG: protein-L-isoaspartate O-methyltransferase [Thermoplasmata archaeon]